MLIIALYIAFAEKLSSLSRINNTFSSSFKYPAYTDIVNCGSCCFVGGDRRLLWGEKLSRLEGGRKHTQD
jgi:hypothetical protein